MCDEINVGVKNEANKCADGNAIRRHFCSTQKGEWNMKKIIAFITAALMAISMAVPAMAASEVPAVDSTAESGSASASTSEEKVNYDLPDPNHANRYITVTLNKKDTSKVDNRGSGLKGVQLALYQVAEVSTEHENGDRTYYFKYVEKLSDLQQDVPLSENTTDTDLESAETAEKIAKFIVDNKISPVDTQTTDDNGKAEFYGSKKDEPDLPLGIYLVYQVNKVSNYEKIKPFLVTIPQKEKDENGKDTGHLIYGIDATPKVEPVPYHGGNHGGGTTPTVTPSGTKAIEGTAREKESTFTFEISAVTEGAPLPTNTKATVTGAGNFQFGQIAFSKSGTYEYKISEVNGNEQFYQYDNTVYYVVYTVENSRVSKTEYFTDAAHTKPVSGITFTNKYEKKSTAVPSVKKVVSGDTPKSSSTFTFTLTPDKADNPMPADAKDGKKSISVNGAGNVDFGTITFTKEGTYEYTVQEEKGSATGYTYDQTKYTVVYTVDKDLKVTSAVMNGDKKAADGDTVEITNKYKAPVTPGKSVKTNKTTTTTRRTTTTSKSTVKKASVLPQTGQLWWPVWVLAAAGAVLLVSGMVRKKRS